MLRFSSILAVGGRSFHPSCYVSANVRCPSSFRPLRLRERRYPQGTNILTVNSRQPDHRPPTGKPFLFGNSHVPHHDESIVEQCYEADLMEVGQQLSEHT